MANAISYNTDSDCEEDFYDAIDSRIKLLPTELVQAILSQTSDAFSLISLAQCCSSFHCAFLADQVHILQTVLRNEIAADVLPDALTTFASARLLHGLELTTSPSTPNEERDYLSDLRQLAELGPASWSIPKALAISELHSNVNFFSSEFASTLEANPFTGITNKCAIVLTPKEIGRIQRSFYRFELFCNLFRNDRMDSEDQRRRFFNNFAPWENEQLASVYEYLFSRLSTAFNDVAEHDVEWGESSIPWLNDESAPDNYYKEHLLSLGLKYLRRLVTASTYQERYKLLELKPEADALYSALSVAADAYEDIPLANLTEQERALYIKPQCFKDSDIGPAEAWRWAYMGETTSDQYFMPYQRPMRRFGYVMYDYDRLCSWPEFHGPFKPASTYDREVRNRNHREMMDSWRKRSDLWLDGARGYWSDGDKSKLVWPCMEAENLEAKSMRLDKWGFPSTADLEWMKYRNLPRRPARPWP